MPQGEVIFPADSSPHDFLFAPEFESPPNPGPSNVGRGCGAVMAVRRRCRCGYAGGPRVRGFDAVVKPFLEEHCVRCHGEKKQKGDLRLDTLARDFAVAACGVALGGCHGADQFAARCRRRMNSSRRPRTSARVVEWIAQQLKEGEAARLAKRERVTFHKLTREEYANTIRDLLGVNYRRHRSRRTAGGPNWQGFERIGSVLSLSPSHVEKYLRRGGCGAGGGPAGGSAEAFSRRQDVWELRYHGQKEKAEKLGSRTRCAWSCGRTTAWMWADEFPASGDYRMRIKLSGMKPPDGRAPHLSFYAKDLDRMLFEQDVVTPEDKPATWSSRFTLPAGIRLPADLRGAGSVELCRGTGALMRGRFFTTIKESGTGRQPWQYKLSDEEWRAASGRSSFVDFVELEGPLESAGPRRAAEVDSAGRAGFGAGEGDPDTFCRARLSPSGAGGRGRASGEARGERDEERREVRSRGEVGAGRDSVREGFSLPRRRLARAA